MPSRKRKRSQAIKRATKRRKVDGKSAVADKQEKTKEPEILNPPVEQEKIKEEELPAWLVDRMRNKEIIARLLSSEDGVPPPSQGDGTSFLYNPESSGSELSSTQTGESSFTQTQELSNTRSEGKAKTKTKTKTKTAEAEVLSDAETETEVSPTVPAESTVRHT